MWLPRWEVSVHSLRGLWRNDRKAQKDSSVNAHSKGGCQRAWIAGAVVPGHPIFSGKLTGGKGQLLV